MTEQDGEIRTVVEESPKCPVELKPMEKWVGEEDTKQCRPCLLGPVVQWYADELKERGKVAVANRLTKTAEESDPLTLCRELDNIKNEVEEPLRERLKDFDCAVQAFKDEDDEKPLEGGSANG